MKRVKLAHVYKSCQPGDVIEVSEEELGQMKRDGRVAEVLADDKAEPAEKKAEPANKRVDPSNK